MKKENMTNKDYTKLIEKYNRTTSEYDLINIELHLLKYYKYSKKTINRRQDELIKLEEKILNISEKIQRLILDKSENSIESQDKMDQNPQKNSPKEKTLVKPNN